MKTACILLRNENELLSNVEYAAIFDEFLKNGFPVSEIRMLPERDDLPLKTSLKALQKEFPFVLVLTKKELLLSVREALKTALKTDKILQDGTGATVFPTENGGVLLAYYGDEHALACVTGVCLPYLKNRSQTAFDRITLRAVGAKETLVKDLINQAAKLGDGKLRFVSFQNYDETVVEIMYSDNASKRLVDGVVGTFVEELSESLYAVDDTPLEKQLVELLKIRGKKISVAESFTGGGIAKRISSVSGASSVYFEGVNTYDETSKMKRLGVQALTLNTLGAVSDKTAYEMAAGLLDSGDCDVAISTTGIAGPNSDRTGAPVGLSFIGIGTKEKVYVYRYVFSGNRKEICEKAINYALFLAYKHLKKE